MVAFFALEVLAALSEIQAEFQNCHNLGMNVEIEKSSINCTYTLFLHHVVQIELTFALLMAVSEVQPIFKTSIFGPETWPLTTFLEANVTVNYC